MIPSSVSISGIKYQVIEVERLLGTDNEKLNGSISYDNTVISIEKNMSDQMKMVTLWHEVIHGILTQAEIEHDEKLVSVLGFGICGFVQENPEILGMIGGEK